MEIRMFRVKVELGHEGSCRRYVRTYIALGLEEADAMERVRSYVLDNAEDGTTVYNVEGWRCATKDLVLIT